MADTIADVTLNGDVYQDLYTATGISVGDALIIQSKTNDDIYIQVSASQPSADSTDGYLLKSIDPPVRVGTGASGCWALGKGPLSVQEDT